MKSLKKIFFVMAVIAMTAFIGCEKENVEPNEEEVVDPDLDNNNGNNDNNKYNSVITALGEISASVENGGTLDNIIDYVKASVEGSEYYEVGSGPFKDGCFTLQMGEVPDKYLSIISLALEDLDNLQISDRSVKISSTDGAFIEGFQGSKKIGQFIRVKGTFTDFDQMDEFWAGGGTLCLFIYCNKAVKISGEIIGDDEYDKTTYLHDYQLRQGWNELVAQGVQINNKLRVTITANNEPEGMKWVFVPKKTLNDFFDSYTIQYKKGLDTDFSTDGPVVISPYYDNEGTEWAFIEGLYEGESFFTAYGKWDAREQSILLQGAIYAERMFYFQDDPTMYYYAVFYPVTYYPHIDVLNYLKGGDNNAGEARLVMNDDGTISYQGGSIDENNGAANGFIYHYHSAETNEYNGRFVVCHDITLTQDYSSSRAKSMAPLLGKRQQEPILKTRNQAPPTSDSIFTSTETFPAPPSGSYAICTGPSPRQTGE